MCGPEGLVQLRAGAVSPEWFRDLVHVDETREDRALAGEHPWIDFLEGRNPHYPVTALRASLERVRTRVALVQADKSTPETRLADNALEYNPASVASLLQLTSGRAAHRASALVADLAESGRRAAARAIALLRSGSPSRRLAGGRGRARRQTRSRSHGSHAGEPRIPAASAWSRFRVAPMANTSSRRHTTGSKTHAVNGRSFDRKAGARLRRAPRRSTCGAIQRIRLWRFPGLALRSSASGRAR